MIQAIASVLGYIIRFFYDLVGQNYFITILLFTLFTKVVLFPLAWIQIKSMEKMNKMSVKQKEIQDKYKNDKEKQTQELMNLYKENKVNPLSGCLPLIIQIPIIFAMFYIVKQPLTYIVQTPQEEIKTYTQQLLNKEDVNEKEMQANELLIAKEHNLINMQVIPGINLGDVPSNVFSKDENKKASPISLAIPILTFIVSFLLNKYSQKNTQQTPEQAEMQKTTNLMMPLMSAFFSYAMPLALGVYWLFGSMLQFVQQFIINKIVKKDKEKILALEKGGKI
ncbi:membrane protein insertase YidC/Oxa1 family [Clostridium sp. CAG:465]|nr:membrane protein insertase YidC/Oxa1 family [Clostridium sp. CAG:465]